MLDQETQQETETEDAADDALYCTDCGHLITRSRWAISIDGHERVFINPAGRVFRICCFSEAPGTTDVGAFTSEHTWFPGFEWNFAICTACSTHIGWQFLAQGQSKSFLGLMKTALTTRSNDGE
jgi:hypothetical protein